MKPAYFSINFLAMANLSNVKGILLDINGVFHVDRQPVDGAVETIERLKNKFPCRFVTNTTTESRETFHQSLIEMELPIAKSEIISAPYAAVLYLRQLDNPSCHLLLSESVTSDFAEFEQSDTNPDVVVIGDIGDRWNYSIMNRVFTMLNNGAELIALHKGKYWQAEGDLQLDIGAFITGLEYSSGTTATVVGKPSSSFFELALAELELPAENVIMVGDDIDSDVGGAQQQGIRGILVKTGKYRRELVENSEVKPDRIIDSIADLEAILD